MALAERHRLPILTFDFAHFRATRPRRGYWTLVVDEARYAESTGRYHPLRLMAYMNIRIFIYSVERSNV
jgi:hypothetical protein